MDPARQTSRTLHEEHRANLELLDRVERALAGAARHAGGRDDAALAGLLAALARQLEHDVGRHFEFEERELFARMREAGEGDIADLLTEEHEAIRAVADEVLPRVHAARAGTLDVAGWRALERGASELAERQVAHIQKEEMALLPLLDDLLDDETDRQLAFAYAAG